MYLLLSVVVVATFGFVLTRELPSRRTSNERPASELDQDGVEEAGTAQNLRRTAVSDPSGATAFLQQPVGELVRQPSADHQHATSTSTAGSSAPGTAPAAGSFPAVPAATDATQPSSSTTTDVAQPDSSAVETKKSRKKGKGKGKGKKKGKKQRSSASSSLSDSAVDSNAGGAESGSAAVEPAAPGASSGSNPAAVEPVEPVSPPVAQPAAAQPPVAETGAATSAAAIAAGKLPGNAAADPAPAPVQQPPAVDQPQQQPPAPAAEAPPPPEPAPAQPQPQQASTQPPAGSGAAASGAHCTHSAPAGYAPSQPLLFPQRYSTAALPNQECENFYGNSWLRSFIDSRQDVCSPRAASAADDGQLTSRITRWDAPTGARFYWMRDVMVDYTKMSLVGDNRHFAPGFVTAAGCDSGGRGLHFYGDDRETALRGFLSTQSVPTSQCDSWVDEPTLVLQHEDIGNLYHDSADKFRLWVSMAALQQHSCVSEEAVAGAGGKLVCDAPSAAATYYYDASTAASSAVPACPAGTLMCHGVSPSSLRLLNLDARMMCGVVDVSGNPHREEDCEGPYFAHYRAWFGAAGNNGAPTGGGPAPSAGIVTKGRDMAGRGRVCYRGIGWATNTPESHIWAKFSDPSDCDSTPSPLLQQFVDYSMGRFGVSGMVPKAYAEAGSSSGGAGGSKQRLVRILYVVRKKKPFNSEPVKERVIANEDAFIAMLRHATPAPPPATAPVDPAADTSPVVVEVDIADFTGMTFQDQLRHARAAHIVIGMHGAGMVHAMHASREDECGGNIGVIELLPAGHGEWGCAHLAAVTGHRYWRWVNSDEKREIPGSGTDVDLDTVKAMVGQAMAWNLGGRRKEGACGGG